MSARGRELLVEWEGFKRTAYRDAAGLLPIGVGHLITKEELNSRRLRLGGVAVPFDAGLSEEQVRMLLAQDLAQYEDAVRKHVLVDLDQDQFDALVSFCFNVGIDAFRKSSLVKCVNCGSLADVPDELRKWT